MESTWCVLAFLPAALSATPWEERLAKRAGRAVPAYDIYGGPDGPNATLVTAEAVAGLRVFMQKRVEPAISAVRKREAALSSTEECFASAAGSSLRYRCCVYYSAMAAAYIESHYGVKTSDSRVTSHREAGISATPARALSPYGALAHWLLTPSPSAEFNAHVLANELIMTAEADDGSYDLAALREAASRLPAPLGRYAARVEVHGILGTLWRCEVSTVHTYLVLEPDDGRLDDILIDVAFKQFLVLPDWLEQRHFEACAASDIFSHLDEAFIGPPAQLRTLFTLDDLRSRLEVVFALTGDSLDEALSRHGELEPMHRLRNDALFALSAPERGGRRHLCGQPTQLPARRKATQGSSST